MASNVVSVRFSTTSEQRLLKQIKRQAKLCHRSISSMMKFYLIMARMVEEHHEKNARWERGIKKAQAQIDKGLVEPYEWTKPK